MKRIVSAVLICTLSQLLSLSPPVVAASRGDIKVSAVSTNPEDYGFAGIAYDPQKYCVGIIEQVLPDCPATGSGLKAEDKILSFKLKENSKEIYAELNRTISHNPHKTLLLTVQRGAETPFVIPVKIGTLKEYPNAERLQAAIKQRGLDSQAIAVTKNLTAIAGFAPDFIEVYDPKEGPSKMLLSARMLGAKVVSAPAGGKVAALLTRAKVAADKPAVWRSESASHIYPYLLKDDEVRAFTILPAGTDAVPVAKRKMPKVLDLDKNWPEPLDILPGALITVHTGERQSSYRPLVQIAGTWPYPEETSEKKSKAAESKKIEQLCIKLVQLINDESLDTASARQYLTGEVLISGNSTRAGLVTVPAYAPFKNLTTKEMQLQVLSDQSAVARLPLAEGKDYVYAFFVSDQKGIWRLSAIRHPGFTDPQKFNLRDEAETANLTEWFKAHKEDMQTLVERCESDLKVHSGNAPDQVTQLLAKTIFESAIKPRLSDIYFAVPSKGLSSTGLLYSPKDDPPPINPYGCIWSEKLADHWYQIVLADRDFFFCYKK